MCDCRAFHPDILLAAKRAHAKPHAVYGLYALLRDNAGPVPSVAGLAHWCGEKPIRVALILSALQLGGIIDEDLRPIGEWSAPVTQHHPKSPDDHPVTAGDVDYANPHSAAQARYKRKCKALGRDYGSLRRPEPVSVPAAAPVIAGDHRSPALLEEDQDQVDLFPSDERERANPVDNRHPGNPWGGAGNQAEAAKLARRDAWLAKILAYAERRLSSERYQRLVTVALEEKPPHWAQQLLDELDAELRIREGRPPPPSLRQGYLKMPITGGAAALRNGSSSEASPPLYHSQAHRKAG